MNVLFDTVPVEVHHSDLDHRAYVTLLGVDETKRKIDALASYIRELLNGYSGEAAAYLCDLANRIAVRTV